MRNKQVLAGMRALFSFKNVLSPAFVNGHSRRLCSLMSNEQDVSHNSRDTLRNERFVYNMNKTFPSGSNYQFRWQDLVAQERVGTMEKVRWMGSFIHTNQLIDTTIKKHLFRFIAEDENDEQRDHPVFLQFKCAIMSYEGKERSSEIRDILSYLSKNHPNFMKFPIMGHVYKNMCKFSKEDFLYVLDINEQFKLSQLAFPLSLACLQFGYPSEAVKVASTIKVNNVTRSAYNKDHVSEMIVQLRKLNGESDVKVSFLKLFGENRAVINDHSHDAIQEILMSTPYNNIVETKISHDHKCLNCGSVLRTLSPDEFSRLRDAIQNKTITRGNPFYVTSPEELEKFKKFTSMIKKHNLKFNVVIDALNVQNIGSYARSYSTKFNKQDHHKDLRKVKVFRDSKVLTEYLLLILTKAINDFDRILISGRHHMKKSRELNKFLAANLEKVSHHYVMNTSADDPFMLYLVTLDPTTYLMTNDFLRREQDLLGFEEGELLSRWLEYRQVQVTPQIDFLFPQNCEIRINVSDDAIHVPVMGENKWFSSKNYKCKWLCATKSSKRN